MPQIQSLWRDPWILILNVPALTFLGALIVSKLVVQAVLSQLATQAAVLPLPKKNLLLISTVSSTEGTYRIQVSYRPFISKCPVEFEYICWGTSSNLYQLHSTLLPESVLHDWGRVPLKLAPSLSHKSPQYSNLQQRSSNIQEFCGDAMWCRYHRSTSRFYMELKPSEISFNQTYLKSSPLLRKESI